MNTIWGNRHIFKNLSQVSRVDTEGILPPALCLSSLQAVGLKICHSSFHLLLFRSRPRCLFRSRPLLWPAAAAGLWKGPSVPRQSHRSEDKSALPSPWNLQRYQGTGDGPAKGERRRRRGGWGWKTKCDYHHYVGVLTEQTNGNPPFLYAINQHTHTHTHSCTLPKLGLWVYLQQHRCYWRNIEILYYKNTTGSGVSLWSSRSSIKACCYDEKVQLQIYLLLYNHGEQHLLMNSTFSLSDIGGWREDNQSSMIKGYSRILIILLQGLKDFRLFWDRVNTPIFWIRLMMTECISHHDGVFFSNPELQVKGKEALAWVQSCCESPVTKTLLSPGWIDIFQVVALCSWKWKSQSGAYWAWPVLLAHSACGHVNLQQTLSAATLPPPWNLEEKEQPFLQCFLFV